MSDKPVRKVTVPRFLQAAEKGERLSMVTAYDHMWAGIMDEAGVDSILVGDSLSMVVQGHNSTLPVTLDEMIYHGRIVMRAVRRALVVVDMPFMSYQVSTEEAVRNAGRIMKETGADAVKLEGGAIQFDTIQAIMRAEIPVMAHVGMRPQAVRQLGGKSNATNSSFWKTLRPQKPPARFPLCWNWFPPTLLAELPRPCPYRPSVLGLARIAAARFLWGRICWG